MPHSFPPRRFPAEWEPHDATWLAWPHNHDDWPGKFGPIEWVFAEIARGVTGAATRSAGERLDLLCADNASEARARECLEQSGVDLALVRLHLLPTDRGWMRDCAPTFVRRADTRALELIDWRFNAWAKYDNWRLDDQVPALVERVTGLSRVQARRPDTSEPMVCEGGGIETDGAGTLLVTEECFLHPSTQVRNPGMTREHYERAFAEHLGVSRTVWLGAGCVGDDTHGHIDDIARFTPSGAVLLAFEDDPRDENHASSADNERRLAAAGLRVVRLPYPAPVVFDGQRLPASYANFYVCNAAVLVPTFNDPRDADALRIIAAAFPDRPAVPVYARDLVWGLGTIHCLTQQQPAR